MDRRRYAYTSLLSLWSIYASIGEKKGGGSKKEWRKEQLERLYLCREFSRSKDLWRSIHLVLSKNILYIYIFVLLEQEE